MFATMLPPWSCEGEGGQLGTAKVSNKCGYGSKFMQNQYQKTKMKYPSQMFLFVFLKTQSLKSNYVNCLLRLF